MSWKEGEIRKFAGNDPRYRDLRKIRTSEDQSWADMYFFHLSMARTAGYPDSMLAEGGRIEFKPDPDADRPKVLCFKPYKTRAGTGSGKASGTKFLNPYHFIPLVAPPEESLIEAKPYLEETPLHDRFAGIDGETPRYSGRVVCRLTTEGPVVVGSKQSKESENEETRVRPFELSDPDAPEDEARHRPAIPGSTLRGLISSMVEAASCSAMRVLSDTAYSRRADHRSEALSAVGRVEPADGVPRLRPLTLSFTEIQGREEPPKKKCRVFLNGYSRSGGSLRVVPKSFLGRVAPRSHSSSNPGEYWYLDLSQTSWHLDKNRVKRLGLDTAHDPLSQEGWEELSEEERSRYTRGVLLILGLDGSKADNVPLTKKHEYFLPFPEPKEDEAKEEVLLDIEPEALERFETAAKASASLSRGGDVNDLPYLPKGRARNLELAEGDLVYYDTNRSGKVSRLAFSAIWRFPVEGNLHEAVRLISKELVPFHGDRKKLTLAERLFGFVEAEGKSALCGRVRFSHGLVEGEPPKEGWYDAEIPLKILASPKPPSPALYFGNNKYLAKRELNLGKHKPQGRKVYLHHREQDLEERCYETQEPGEKRRLKMKVTPLRQGTSFLFHVDFLNLTGEELGHLLYALRPTEAFRHKLGLGKPIGLGRVVVAPIGMFFVDREACYGSQGLFGSKYATADLPRGADGWTGLPKDLESRYRHELEAVEVQEEVHGGGAGSYPTIEELVTHTRDRIPEQVRWAIELVGAPASVERVGAEVTYPVVADPKGEGEHFQWFGYNDDPDGLHEFLMALEPGGELPTLTRQRKPERPKSQGRPRRGRR